MEKSVLSEILAFQESMGLKLSDSDTEENSTTTQEGTEVPANGSETPVNTTKVKLTLAHFKDQYHRQYVPSGFILCNLGCGHG